MEKWWSRKRGAIAVIDSSTGQMECLACGAVWISNLRSRPGRFPVYCRGCQTCHACGANTKTKLPVADVLTEAERQEVTV
jgi:hypothetical protein